MFGESVTVGQNHDVQSRNGDWGDYDEHDYVKIMRMRESQQRKFRHNSPQLSVRPSLIGHLRHQVARNKATTPCYHLAVHLLDFLMDNYTVHSDSLMIMAEACLSLAIKFEENVIVSCSNPSKNKAMIKWEKIILRFFDWNLTLTTVPHFLQYCMEAIMSDDEIDHLILRDGRSKTVLVHELHLNVDYLLFEITDHVHFNFYKSSILAAAIIATTRHNMNLPSWTLQLQILTGYTTTDFEEVHLLLLGKLAFKCEQCNN